MDVLLLGCCSTGTKDALVKSHPKTALKGFENDYYDVFQVAERFHHVNGIVVANQSSTATARHSSDTERAGRLQRPQQQQQQELLLLSYRRLGCAILDTLFTNICKRCCCICLGQNSRLTEICY